MKLEVGMYVRTKRGQIGKVITIEKDNVAIEFNRMWQDVILRTNIVKEPSFNIIDLIEVGDVIIDKEGHKYPINYEFETDYNGEYNSYEITIDDHITLFLKDDLSIVTKEQFSSMEYKI